MVQLLGFDVTIKGDMITAVDHPRESAGLVRLAG